MSENDSREVIRDNLEPTDFKVSQYWWTRNNRLVKIIAFLKPTDKRPLKYTIIGEYQRDALTTFRVIDSSWTKEGKGLTSDADLIRQATSHEVLEYTLKQDILKEELNEKIKSIGGTGI